jgi:Tfp pilus assembly major pilin PilA
MVGNATIRWWSRFNGSHDVRMRRAHTVLELVVVLGIAAIVLAIALPRTQRTLDRLSVHAAASDVAATLAAARTIALAGAAAVGVDVDSARGVLRVRRGVDVLLSRGIGHAHGVTLRHTRDSLAFDAHGLGRGAANLSIVIRRGAAVETVFVSRLGRVR